MCRTGSILTIQDVILLLSSRNLLDEVETSKIHEEGIKATQDKVDRLNDQVEYLTGLTESMGTRVESTLDFVEKVFSAQQKDYVLDGENGSGHMDPAMEIR